MHYNWCNIVNVQAVSISEIPRNVPSNDSKERTRKVDRNGGGEVQKKCMFNKNRTKNYKPFCYLFARNNNYTNSNCRNRSACTAYEPVAAIQFYARVAANNHAEQVSNLIKATDNFRC